ncbi:MAG TPA: tetratricopeptide repeat protein [Vicinamibacterales bacterium]|jgi:cytochrome c-type biogenesis protein CcmH/NrfG|nr:tetratricopeptide repeat protein [Vicinamibacterales bacterium]
MPSGRVWVNTVCIAALATMVAAVTDASRRSDAKPDVTFTRDVAPIMFSRCAPCHRPGEVGPFSLITYEDVKRRARQIAEATASRVMPPWPPEPGHGTFAGERRLTDAEVATLQRWVASGAPRGDRADLPPTPTWKQGWQLGQPDLVVRMNEPYEVPADGPDIFRKFVVPIPGQGTRYVRAIEFRPDNPRVLHHAIMHLDPTGEARRIDGTDREPGIGGMLFTEGISPDGHFLGWSPGVMPTVAPPDLAWRLDPGTDLLMQLHLLPTGKAERIQASVGFFFTATPPSRTGLGLQLGSYTIDIPPDDPAYTVEDSYVVPVDVEVHAIYPHAHYLGKDIRVTATLPDGTTKPLIWIKDWNFYWQGEYRYAVPVDLPKGTTIAMRYTYDNSAKNSRNPHSPPRRIVYGGQSSNEMANTWMQIVPKAAGDLAQLKEDYARKAATRYVAGYVAMLAANPERSSLHAPLGFAYLRAGEIENARRHLLEAVRVGANDVEEAALVQYNLGNVEAALGNRAEAAAHFAKAIDLRPGFAEAMNNLGVMRQSDGRLDEATGLYRQALAAKPTYAEAHNNLGVMLQAQGKLDEAITHFQEAVRLNPSYALAKENLAAAIRERDKR